MIECRKGPERGWGATRSKCHQVTALQDSGAKQPAALRRRMEQTHTGRSASAEASSLQSSPVIPLSTEVLALGRMWLNPFHGSKRFTALKGQVEPWRGLLSAVRGFHRNLLPLPLPLHSRPTPQGLALPVSSVMPIAYEMSSCPKHPH